MYHKKLTSIVCVLIAVVLISGCVSGDADKSNTTNTKAQASKATTNDLTKAFANKSKAEVVDAINAAEQDLYGDKSNLEFDKDKAQNLVNTYNVFTNRFADDPQSAGYLFKTAEVLRSLKKFNEAVSVYSKIVSDYPNFDKVPHSLFLKGFSHENDLKNLPQAKGSYEEFLQRFPQHELADDVQFSLDNLGKSPEEIIQEFEKKRKENEGK